jgi:hypothetical protein
MRLQTLVSQEAASLGITWWGGGFFVLGLQRVCKFGPTNIMTGGSLEGGSGILC